MTQALYFFSPLEKFSTVLKNRFSSSNIADGLLGAPNFTSISQEHVSDKLLGKEKINISEMKQNI